jgi:polar amino acid transport system substrate-binding protein
MDEKFPPFAFRDSAGALTGFLPLLADALCADLRISCQYVTRDTASMQGALAGKQADAAVYMTRPGEIDFAKLDFTRPFLRPFGRFAGRTSSPIDDTDVRTLAGKRIGVRRGTSHERFIQTHFNRSLLVPFATPAELYEAARTGSVDIMFDDAFRLMFWMQGARARECCHFIGHGFIDKASFSHALTFAVRREDTDIRKLLDYGLDRLQSSGRFENIYNRFFPQSPY